MRGKLWRLWLVLMPILVVSLALGGCAKTKKWLGVDKGEDDEEVKAPEAVEETVMIDGKPYVRSKNPYWLVYPSSPEYLYVEKGTEFVGMQKQLVNALAKAVGREAAKTQGVPPDKVQEMVRQEVERVLREQGLEGFMSRGKGEKTPYGGRAVAVIPDLDTPKSYDGLNRTMAVSLAESLRRQKNIAVSGDDKVSEALRKAGVAGKLSVAGNIKTLGNFLGVQGIVLTGIMPPERGSTGVMVMEVYDTYSGTKTQPVVSPAEAGGLNAANAMKFAQQNALRVAGELLNMEWFGRVEFVKEGKVYLSLGQNAGLKVGDRLKVVSPGKAVVNPQTGAVLGYTADVSQGELKVTELLGTTGAVAQSLSGGPFNANDKVKFRQ
jgi:hypothetical protein